MASKAMWEVDPETRSKLLEISKTNSNTRCIDCPSPSPQWASPKLGIFLCLSCAGVHRGLGVHISFVRSITMDAFKPAEIERMRLGGNAPWRAFFENHPDNVAAGIAWDDVTIKERYDGNVAMEWKERLTARVDGVEYVPGAAPVSKPQLHRSATTPIPTTTTTTQGRASPAPSLSSARGGGKAKVDATYFARLGSANASRPADVPPSQGGKYAGFGSEMPPARREEGPPGFEELQRDPVMALTRGLGWFGGVVGKMAGQVNEGYIAPAAARIAETDIANQARITAAQLARTAQTGAQGAGRTLNEGFNRFVEGGDARRGAGQGVDEERRGFWDSFGVEREERGLGTSAMRTGGGGSGSGVFEAGGGGKKEKEKEKEKDEWDNW